MNERQLGLRDARRAAALLVATMVAASGCINISLTKKCEHSYGLHYRLADPGALKSDAPLPFAVGVGDITIDAQYNHAFVTEHEPGGMLRPHENQCWLEDLNVMAADVMRDYLLERSGRASTGGDAVMKNDTMQHNGPRYTVTGRLMELSAATDGAVTVRMDVRVIQGDPDGRAPKVVIARAFEVRDGVDGVALNTGGRLEKIPEKFSDALVMLTRAITKEIEALDELEKKSAEARRLRAPIRSGPFVTLPPVSFTLRGVDAAGRVRDVAIHVDTLTDSAVVVYRDENGMPNTAIVGNTRKRRNGTGIEFGPNGRAAVDVSVSEKECRVELIEFLPDWPSRIPCDCDNARAFLAWRRELQVQMAAVPPEQPRTSKRRPR